MYPKHLRSGVEPETAPLGSLARYFGFGQLLSNMIGAGFCAFYFLFLDNVHLTSELDQDIAVIIAMTVFLAVLGTYLFKKWEGDIKSAWAIMAEGKPVPEKLMNKARRKVLMGPLASAVVSLHNWGLAAIFMGGYVVFHPYQYSGESDLQQGFRVAVGIMVSGMLTASIVYFLAEAQFRRIRPLFFNGGKISETSGVVRFRVRARLLFSFAMVSLVPTVLVAFLVHHRINNAMGSEDAAHAAGLTHLLIFAILAEATLAFFLSRFTSASIADPVKDMEEAMCRVRKGDLSVQVIVRDANELGMLSESFNSMIHGLRDRDRIKETFGRFVSPAIARTIMEHPPELGGENTEVTVLFSDIRNYTTICEELNPSEVIEMLNAYFGFMVRAIEENKGLVYQFVGDAIMAVFNAPVRLADHATRAVEAALAMREALKEFNRLHRVGRPPLSMGIGINTGPVVAGIIGSAQRMEYRVVGDTVNLASRVESLNKDLGTEILLSGTTARALVRPFDLKPMGSKAVKGKTQTVDVFAL